MERKYIALQLVQILLALLALFSMYMLLMYDPTSYDDTTLYLDMILLIKYGSLFIGSGVFLILLESVKKSVLLTQDKTK